MDGCVAMNWKQHVLLAYACKRRANFWHHSSTRDTYDLLDDDIKAQVDAFNKQLEVRLGNKNFLFIPGSETMFKLDEYDGFHSPTGDSAYWDNTSTDDQYGSMAAEYGS